MLTARAAIVSMGLALSACSAFQNTLAQELALERWEMCKSAAPDVALREIQSDGQIRFTYESPTGHTAVRNCLREAATEQGKRRAAAPAVASSRSSAPVTRPAADAAAIAAATAAAKEVPVWAIGDEWAYRYDQPSGTGTFVWRVDRIDRLRDEPHYVIKTGTREIFYRVWDVAFTEERVGSETIRSITPSDWRMVSFPLTVGKSWDMTYQEKRPVERQTEDIERTCQVQTQESVTVPAGAFHTMKIDCKNKRNGAWVLTVWYAPEIRQHVRLESAVTGGRYTREMLAYRIR